MKRRTRWIIAFSLALLAACVGVWKWSERPPYAFMEGAKLNFIYSGTAPAGDYIFSYVSSRPMSEVMAAARRETGDGSWECRDGWDCIPWQTPETHLPKVQISELAPQTVEGYNAGIEGRFPALPSGVRTFISVHRQPSILDHMKGWWFRWRWKGWPG